DIEVKNGRVAAVVTPNGRIETEIVLCAAGIWGPVIGKMVGVPIPFTPLAHLVIRSGHLPELKEHNDWVTMPIVRHQDKDQYSRNYYDMYLVGSYRHDPIPRRAEDLPKPAMIPF